MSEERRAYLDQRTGELLASLGDSGLNPKEKNLAYQQLINITIEIELYN